MIWLWQTRMDIGGVAGQAGSVDFNAEAGGLADGLSDLGKALEREVAAFKVGDRPGGGIDLDEINAGTTSDEFL